MRVCRLSRHRREPRARRDRGDHGRTSRRSRRTIPRCPPAGATRTSTRPRAPSGTRRGSSCWTPAGARVPLAPAGTELTPDVQAHLRAAGVQRVRVREFAFGRWQHAWLFLLAVAGLTGGSVLVRRDAARAQLDGPGRPAPGRRPQGTPQAALGEIIAAARGLQRDLPAMSGDADRARAVVERVGRVQAVPALQVVEGRDGARGRARHGRLRGADGRVQPPGARAEPRLVGPPPTACSTRRCAASTRRSRWRRKWSASWCAGRPAAQLPRRPVDIGPRCRHSVWYSRRAVARPCMRSAMQVILAQPRGFCAGVERAIEIVEAALEQVRARRSTCATKSSTTRGSSRTCGRRACVSSSRFDQVPEGAVTVFSAHGVSEKVERDAEKGGLRSLDATCPLVSKVHVEGRRYAASGLRHHPHRPREPSGGRRHRGPDPRTGPAGERRGRRGRAARPRSGEGRLHHPDHAVRRRHAGRDHRPAAALPEDCRSGRQGHLLRDAEPPGRRPRAGRGSRPRARRGRAEQLQFQPPVRGQQRQRRAELPGGGSVDARPRVAAGQEERRHHRRRLDARGSWCRS